MKMPDLSELKPERVFKYFKEICAIPHGSGNTGAICDYLCSFAADHKLEHIKDDVGNVIIRKPATPGMEERPAVILQGHMDMVAVCTPGSGIDMTKEGIKLQINGDRLSAVDTSMGGDDGIAVAMCLAILESDSIKHSALEVLFTMDEETGMDGALGLDMNLLKGRRLINIDSEEEGTIYVGCAGGARVHITLPIISGENEDQSGNGNVYEIRVSGCRGGHSGSEIYRGGANAIKIAGRILYEMNSRMPELRFISIEGGVVDNAIPTEAVLTVAGIGTEEEAQRLSDQLSADILKEYGTTDPDMNISIKRLSDSGSSVAASKESTDKLGCLLNAVPNGVQSMSHDMEDLVETSLNIGVIHTLNMTDDISDSKFAESSADPSQMKAAKETVLQFAVRSSVASAKRHLIDKLCAIAELAGAQTEVSGDYPGWKYEPDSPLRDHMTAVYREMYGKEPVVKAIHAGLECGFFVSGMPGLDCVSIGPDMSDVHTTSESLSISSVGRMWEYLCRVLETM